MKDLLHKLHQKPEHHKKNIALGTSLLVTIMIFGIWVSVLPAKFNDVGGVAKESQKKLEDSISPLATVKASFDEVKKTLGEFGSDFKQNQVNLETVTNQ